MRPIRKSGSSRGHRDWIKSTLARLPELSYSHVMQNMGFEDAAAGRIDDMLDACTRCGACFTACPIAAPAGLADADPTAMIEGMLDIVRIGTGPEASQKWAKACMLSGECIKACHYGVNPRFLLAVARWRWRSMSMRRRTAQAGRAEFPQTGRRRGCAIAAAAVGRGVRAS